jgi:transcriptional regulator with XRE-family HTH domain
MPLDRYQRWIAEGLRNSDGSQTGLAAALRLTQPRISEIISGKRKVKATEIPLAANYLGIPPPDTGDIQKLFDELPPDLQAEALGYLEYLKTRKTPAPQTPRTPRPRFMHK